MATVTLTIEEYEALISLVRDISPGAISSAPAPGSSSKKKRKVSKYSKQFGKELKKLKALHPRTKITALMKRAHSATRRAMK